MLKRPTMEMLLGGGKRSPVLWCPQGKFAAYLLPMAQVRLSCSRLTCVVALA